MQDSDLVVLDFAVNDGHVSPFRRDKDGYSFPDGARRGFEQLVRGSCGLVLGGMVQAAGNMRGLSRR